MKKITLLLFVVAILASIAAITVTASRHVTGEEAAPIFVRRFQLDIATGRWSQ